MFTLTKEFRFEADHYLPLLGRSLQARALSTLHPTQEDDRG